MEKRVRQGGAAVVAAGKRPRQSERLLRPLFVPCAGRRMPVETHPGKKGWDSTFFQNRDCPWFPCHAGVGEDTFNCLFCYCPLYALGESCGGDCTYTVKGIKSCMECAFPHKKENYGEVLRRARAVLDMAARPPREAGEDGRERGGNGA